MAGKLWVWGYNGHGQLGLGDIEDRWTPTQVGIDTDWVQVASGLHHTLAIKNDGTLWGWGWNEDGQLGLNDTQDRFVPTQVGTATDWVAVSAGDRHSLALKTDGTLWSCGRNNYGQLGIGSTTDSKVFVRISPSYFSSAIITIGAGSSHSVVLLQDGTLRAWGWNLFGQLGDQTQNNEFLPQYVLGFFPNSPSNSAMAIAVGNNHNLAITVDGRLLTWGMNSYGQLGLGTTESKNLPTEVGDGSDWAKVHAGFHTSYAVKNDGTLWAWGSNSFGQTGDGTTTQRLSPVLINGVSNIETFGAGRGNHVLAIDLDGAFWGWGWNSSGQLGLGDTENRLIPTHGPPIQSESVSIGGYASFVIEEAGTPTSEPETLLTDTSFILYSTETTSVDAAITVSASESLSADLSVSAFTTESFQADLFPTVYASESLLPDLAIRAFSLESFLGDALFQVDVRESLDSDLSLRIWAPELTQVDTRLLIGTLEAFLADVRVDTSYVFARETLRADASYILYTVEHQASDFLAKSGTLETTIADLNVRSFSLEQLAADLTVTIESSITGSPITQAIYRKLIRDPYLTSRLSTYQAGPAIFSAEPVPADATLPFIVISPGVAGIPRDTKTTFGREFLRDVRVYAEATGSSIEIDNLSERVRTLFHRQSLAVAGYSAWRVTARGPILAPTDSSIYGRLVTLTLSLDRTSPRVTVQQEPAAPTFLAAFYRRLTQDNMLFGSLSSYEGFPAVFTSPPVPRDARPPYIIITPALSDDLRDTKTTLGRELTWEVRVYTPADGSMVLLESLMERVVDLFHRQPLAVEGHTPYLAEVSGPYPAPDGDITTTYGLAATLRLATTQS